MGFKRLASALHNPARIDLPESPPKWSGSTRRRGRGSECRSGPEGSSPSLSWSDGMGSCLSSGKVGGCILGFLCSTVPSHIQAINKMDKTETRCQTES